LMVFISRNLLLSLLTESEPMIMAGNKQAEVARDSLRETDYSTMRQTVDVLWLRYLRPSQLRELMQVRALGSPLMQGFLIALAVLLLSLRIPFGDLPPRIEWFFGVILTAFLVVLFVPPAMVGSSGVLSKVSLQTSVPRRLLLMHYYLLLMSRSFTGIVVSCILLLPWTDGSFPGVLCTALFLWGIFIMNTANAFLIHEQLRLGTTLVPLGVKADSALDFGTGFAYLIMFIMGQVPLLPLTILLFQSLDWEAKIPIAPHPVVFAAVMVYAVAYSLGVTHYAAVLLEQDDVDFFETAFNNRN
jgi:hypothetical protein